MKSSGFVLMACVLLLFVSCASGESDKIEISIIHGWGSTEPDHVAMRKIYSDFAVENPDVAIRLVSMPHADDVVQKLGDMLMVGDVPDLIFFGGAGNDGEYVYKFMTQNNLAVDIVPYIENDIDFGKRISRANLETHIENDGALYSLSDVLLASGGYWYNKEIFSQAGVKNIPETWDDFFDMCAQIQSWADENENGIRIFSFTSEGALYLLDHMINMPEKESLENALMRLKKIYGLELQKSDDRFFETYTYRDETTLFNEGLLATYVNGVWAASMIEKNIDAEYALLPAGKNVSLSCESASLGFVVGNSGNEKRIEAAMRFLSYIMSDNVQRRILLETEQVPASPVVYIEDMENDMPRFFRALKKVRDADMKIGVPNNLWTPHEKNIFQAHLLDFLVGKISLQDLLEMLSD